MRRFSLICGLLCITLYCFSQRELTAKRIQSEITIDGNLDESAWGTAEVATGFKNWQPLAGATPSNTTEVKMMYDDKAIYIGALLQVKQPNQILRQLSERDDSLNTNWFRITIDAYQDGQNGIGFFLHPQMSS